eukprot:7109114-Prymnesium_polylepis.1
MQRPDRDSPASAHFLPGTRSPAPLLCCAPPGRTACACGRPALASVRAPDRTVVGQCAMTATVFTVMWPMADTLNYVAPPSSAAPARSDANKVL